MLPVAERTHDPRSTWVERPTSRDRASAAPPRASRATTVGTPRAASAAAAAARPSEATSASSAASPSSSACSSGFSSARSSSPETPTPPRRRRSRHRRDTDEPQPQPQPAQPAQPQPQQQQQVWKESDFGGRGGQQLSAAEKEAEIMRWAAERQQTLSRTVRGARIPMPVYPCTPSRLHLHLYYSLCPHTMIRTRSRPNTPSALAAGARRDALWPCAARARAARGGSGGGGGGGGGPEVRVRGLVPDLQQAALLDRGARP